MPSARSLCSHGRMDVRVDRRDTCGRFPLLVGAGIHVHCFSSRTEAPPCGAFRLVRGPRREFLCERGRIKNPHREVVEKRGRHLGIDDDQRLDPPVLA